MLEFIAKYWLEVLFGAVSTGVSVALRNVNKRLKEERERNQAIENGLRDVLRLQILDNYEKAKSDGKISVSRKDAIDSAYKSYHALGGNGTVTQIHNEIMEMPIL